MGDATWYVVKCVPDPRRREPRNVGVVLNASDRWASRFFAEDPETGNVDGRRLKGLGVDADVYKSWVDYYRRKSSSEGWEDVARLQRQRPHSFFTERGGYLLDDVTDLYGTLNQLFADIVGERQSRTDPTDALRAQVDAIFQRASITPVETPVVRASWGRRHEVFDDVEFDLGYTNGQLHLMDRINVSSPQASVTARDFWARAEAARRAGAADSFVAFYSSGSVSDPDHLDSVLRPLEDQAYVVDVDDPSQALSTIGNLMGHPA